MRQLLVHACLCLMTWSSATGPDPTLPPDNFTSSATNKVLGEPQRVLGERSENIGANPALGDTYAALALPLAPLGLLLKPIIYRSPEEICDALTGAARSNDLPAPFFIRLLYQESSFRPHAISSAGALGIAQFMPETAAERGLDNPFDPLQAIPESARLLRDLSKKFGNLGSPPLPTMRARSASKIGWPKKASCRRRRNTTSRRSPAGRRRRGPSPKPAARR